MSIKKEQKKLKKNRILTQIVEAKSKKMITLVKIVSVKQIMRYTHTHTHTHARTHAHAHGHAHAHAHTHPYGHFLKIVYLDSKFAK